MSVEIKIPSVGESVSEVEMGEWLKNEGDSVSTDEIVVMLESDKATVELPAPSSGVIGKILKKQGDVAAIGEVVAILEEGSGASNGSSAKTETRKRKCQARRQARHARRRRQRHGNRHASAAGKATTTRA